MNPCDFCPNPNTCDENDMCDRAKREGPGDELRKEFEAAYRARFPSAATFQTSVFFIDDVGEYQEAKVFTAFAMWKEARFTPTQGADARPVAWRARGYAQFKTGKPSEWRYYDGSAKPSLNNPECCDIEPVYATRDAAPSDPAIDALKWIKVLVCGDSAPRWTNAHQTTISRGMIADIIDKAIASRDKT